MSLHKRQAHDVMQSVFIRTAQCCLWAWWETHTHWRSERVKNSLTLCYIIFLFLQEANLRITRQESTKTVFIPSWVFLFTTAKVSSFTHFFSVCRLWLLFRLTMLKTGRVMFSLPLNCELHIIWHSGNRDTHMHIRVLRSWETKPDSLLLDFAVARVKSDGKSGGGIFVKSTKHLFLVL